MNRYNKINKFSSVIKSEKFKKDFEEINELIGDLHTSNILKDDFCWFLLAYPMSDNKKKIFRKLNGKKKFGMLSRHLVSVSSRLGMNQIFLHNFYKLKEKERTALKSLKNEDWMYYYNFFDEQRIERNSDTIEEQIDITKREISIKERWNTLSLMLMTQTMDLIDFCIDKYDARESKINKLLGEGKLGD